MSHQSSIKSDKILDCRGLSCPIPLLKVKKTIDTLQPGQILEVWGTDPATKIELQKFCEKGGYKLIEIIDTEGYFKCFIKK
jgi:tRNA 2-thiouridine synthesizing protein A